MSTSYVNLDIYTSEPLLLTEYNQAALFSTSLQAQTINASTVNTDQASIVSMILQSGIVTGSPIEPNSAQIASTQYVDQRITDLIGASTANLDTLKELADALGNDDNFASTMTTSLATKAGLALSNTFEGATNTFTNNVIINQLDVGTRFVDLETLQSNHTQRLDTNDGEIEVLQTDMAQAKTDITTLFTNPTITGQATIGSIVTNDLTITSGMINGPLEVNGPVLLTNDIQLGDNAAEDVLLIKAATTFDTDATIVLPDASNLMTVLSGIDADLSTMDTRLDTAEPIIADHETRLDTIESGSFVFPSLNISGELTTGSIVDNGNLSIKGNTVVGDAITDSLTVGCPATFTNTVTVAGTNVTSKFSSLDTTISGVSSRVTTIESGSFAFPSLNISGALTTGSITDNGNLAVKGNTTIGDAGTDTLTVACPATFNQNVTLASGKRVTAPLVTVGTQDVASKWTSQDTLIAAKANTADAVLLASTQTIAGQKEFTLAPTINSVQVATTTDVSNAINALVGSAPTTLDTLNEIATALQADESSINTILSTMTTLNGVQTVSNKSFTACTATTATAADNTTALATTAFVQGELTPVKTRVTALETNPNVSGNLVVAGSITGGSISTTGNVTIGNATADNLTVNSAATFTTGLSAPAITLAGTSLATTLSNMSAAIDAKQDTMVFDVVPTSGSGNPLTSDAVFEGLAGKQATLVWDTTPVSASVKPVTSGGLFTALAGKQATLVWDTTPVSASVKPVTSGGLFTAFATKADTSATVQLTGAQTVAGVKTFSSVPVIGSVNAATVTDVSNLLTAANAWTNTNTYSNMTRFSKPANLYAAGTVTTNVCTINYSTIAAGLIQVTASTAAMTLALTNVPTTAQATYDLVFLIDVSTNEFCFQTITVNGSAVTMKKPGGALAVNASATTCVQSVSIVMNSGTCLYALSTLANMW